MSPSTATRRSTSSTSSRGAASTQSSTGSLLSASDTALYRHSLRPKWGLSILVWEKAGKCAFQFEDGKLRVFKRSYLNLFNEVERPGRVADHLKRVLKRRLRSQTSIERKKERRAKKKDIPQITLAQQIAHFKGQWPEGFQGETWKHKMRGVDAKRRLKRHRGALVEDAKRLLTAEVLESLIVGERDIHEYWAELDKVLSVTTLLTKSARKAFTYIPSAERRTFINHLHDFLHNENAAYAVRFERFVSKLTRLAGTQPSWSLVTFWAAITFPNDHVIVRPTRFRKQARLTDPDLVFPKMPGSMVYKRALRMADNISKALVLEKLDPTDFLDVYDFIAECTRPKALKAMKKKG